MVRLVLVPSSISPEMVSLLGYIKGVTPFVERGVGESEQGWVAAPFYVFIISCVIGGNGV